MSIKYILSLLKSSRGWNSIHFIISFPLNFISFVFFSKSLVLSLQLFHSLLKFYHIVIFSLSYRSLNLWWLKNLFNYSYFRSHFLTRLSSWFHKYVYWFFLSIVSDLFLRHFSAGIFVSYLRVWLLNLLLCYFLTFFQFESWKKVDFRSWLIWILLRVVPIVLFLKFKISPCCF